MNSRAIERWRDTKYPRPNNGEKIKCTKEELKAEHKSFQNIDLSNLDIINSSDITQKLICDFINTLASLQSFL